MCYNLISNQTSLVTRPRLKYKMNHKLFLKKFARDVCLLMGFKKVIMFIYQ